MMSEQEKIVRNHAKRINSRIPVEYRALEPGAELPIRACTDLKTAKVEIDESWKPDDESFFFDKGEKSGIDALCKDVVAHEIAGHIDSKHTQGCPGNEVTHAVHKNVVWGALKKFGKAGRTPYMTNAVQDIVANTLIRGIQGHTNAGLTEFYKKNLEVPTKFFEAYVKFQLATWGRIQDITYVRSHFTNAKDTNAKEVNNAWRSALRELGLRIYHSEYNRHILSNKQDWPKIMEVLTRHLGPLLEDCTEPPTSPGSRKGEPVDEHEGNAAGGVGNPFDDRLKDPDVQKKVARHFYEQKIGRPQFMNQTEALLRLYQSLGSTPLIAEAETIAAQVPIIPYQHKPTQDLSRASMTKFGITPDGQIEFYEPTQRLEIPFHFRKHKIDLPEYLVAIADRSPSMLEALEPGNDTTYIPWGNKSKWHFLLQSYFTTLNDLAKMNKLQYIKNAALLFADETLDSGIHKGGQLDKLCRHILEHPPGKGGTSINMQTIKTYCLGRPKVIITLSDGHVSNWNEIESEFLQATAPHPYAHIQIGPHANMSLSLTQHGRKVNQIQNGKDLIQVMRGITAEAYSR